MKHRRILLLLTALVGCSLALFSQTPASTAPKQPPATTASNQKATAMVLEYFDDDKQLKIFNSEGFSYGSVYLGMELVAGDRVQTQKSTVELRLNPNGSIFKIAANTNFQIKSFQGNSSAVHDFAILSGKLRTVAAKTGAPNSYRFNTPTAVAGVRGTDFGIEVNPGKIDKLVVREGSVDFTQNSSGKTINLSTGMGADALAPTFESRPFTTQDLSNFFSDLPFSALNPGQVPGQPETKGETTPNKAAETPPAAGTTPGAAAGSPGAPADGSKPPADGSDAASAAAAPDLSGAALEAIKKFLGIEIGTITIQSTAFGKLIVQPKISLDKFKAALYLPIIYKDNVFDPNDWYHPLGNNEWSFGSDQGGSDAGAIVSDFLTDLVLKIKYIELFEKGDPFFLKVGSLPSMTLGHGILINEYANDSDFPAIRRLGVNMGIDGGNIAIELLTNDLAKPEIFGARLLWRPAFPSFKLGTGVSVAADINPLSGLSVFGSDLGQTLSILEAKHIKPMIFNIAIDLDLPIIEGDIFSLTAFADFGGMVPYYTNSFFALDGSEIAPGFKFIDFATVSTEPLGLAFRNYGVQAGVLGKALFLDYRLEYQIYDGTFEPGYYGQAYDRIRGQRALRVIAQAKDPSIAETGMTKMGIFGKAGANILDLVYISFGYKFPFVPNAADQFSPNLSLPDYFTSEIRLNKERMPFGIGFSLGYDRSFFKEMFWTDNRYNFVDEYAVFKGIADVPVGQFFSLRLAVGTAAKRDSSGNIDMSAGHPTMSPVLTIETVF